MNIDSDKKIVDYFACIGLNEKCLKLYPEIEFDSTQQQLQHQYHDPIVDLIIIDKTLKEQEPQDYECLFSTPNGYSANLNGGSSRNHELYLCFRRGRDKPPISDIGYVYNLLFYLIFSFKTE
jgi:DENN domain-containing protein 4